MFIHKHFDYEKIKGFAPMVREYEVLNYEWLFRKSAWWMLFSGLVLDCLQPRLVYKIVYAIVLVVLAMVYLLVIRCIKKYPEKYRYSIYIFKIINLLWCLLVCFGQFVTYFKIRVSIVMAIVSFMVIFYEIAIYLSCLMLQRNIKHTEKTKRIFWVFLFVFAALVEGILILLSSGDNKYMFTMLYFVIAAVTPIIYHGINQYMFTRVYRTEIEADIPPKRTVKRKKKSKPEENEQKE